MFRKVLCNKKRDLFLQEFSAKYEEFKHFFEDLDSLCELVLITDMTNHLNTLNLKLQKTNQTISQLVSHVDSFGRKLQLLKNQLQNNIFHFFPLARFFFKNTVLNVILKNK